MTAVARDDVSEASLLAKKMMQTILLQAKVGQGEQASCQHGGVGKTAAAQGKTRGANLLVWPVE